MFSPARSRAGLAAAALAAAIPTSGAPQADRQSILAAMKRATSFMVEKVATNGGYVWNYLPDLSRRWGEMEARETMIWIQPPGTPTMGHLYLDAYHATGDEYYYAAAEHVAGALISSQHSSGGWNYMADFAGERSLRDWYDTVGANGWRLEEFQHYWGNATFDDAGTAEASTFLLRLYVEKRDPKYRPALDRAIAFVLESQYPIGAWPQRFPPRNEFVHHGKPDYTSYLTFNDDVAAQNIDFLLKCYQALGDARLLDAIVRGMNAFLVTQQGPPQPGWALQYTPNLKPVGARTYEPDALVTHTTAANIDLLLRFYRLTGETKFLARIPEAIDWLEGLALPPGVAPRGRSHPTFIELDTNRPLYVHREGSNVVNGRYYADYDPRNTIGHYSAFRAIDTAGLRKRYAEAKALPAAELARTSPLAAGAGPVPLPRFFAVDTSVSETVDGVLSGLNEAGYWPAPLGYGSHPFTRQGSSTVAPGDYSRAHVGDETDTSPYPDPDLRGISVAAFVRNMSVLIRALDEAPVVWPVDNLSAIGGHPVRVVGAPRVVDGPFGRALEFDGARDGLFVETNPLRGLARFTVEVVLQPAPDGAEEQRFLHMEEDGTANRALVELRLTPASVWSLDTYLRYGDADRTLLDRSIVHQAGQWHAVALTFDGRSMAHFVDGVEEARGDVAFVPLGSGRTSIGVRQNLVSFFKGRISLIRVTPDVLAPESMLKPPR